MALLKASGLTQDPISDVLGDSIDSKSDEKNSIAKKKRKPTAKRGTDRLRRNIRTKLFDDGFSATDDFSLPTESLGELFQSLRAQIDTAFASVGEMVSKNLQQSLASRGLAESGVLIIHDNADVIQHVGHVAEQNSLKFVFSHNETIWLLHFTGATFEWSVSGIDIPPGSQLRAVKFYSADSLVTVLESSGDEVPDASAGATVYQTPLSEVGFADVELAHVNGSKGLPNFFDNVVMARPFEHPLEEIAESKKRLFVDVSKVVRLALAPPRGRGGGLAAIVSAQGKRILLLDLESDEDPVEPAEESGDAQEGGAQET